jgi:hypothetical protein
VTDVRYSTIGLVTHNRNHRDLTLGLAEVAANPGGLRLDRSVDGGPWEPVDITAIRELVAHA